MRVRFKRLEKQLPEIVRHACFAFAFFVKQIIY